MALAWGKCARGEKWKAGRGTSKCQGTGKIVRYNRGTLRVACVTSVSVWFRNKEWGTKVKDCAKNGASKRAERGWGRKEGKFLPLLNPSLSFFGSRFISRVAKTENPVPRLSLLRNQRHSMTFSRFIRLIIRDQFLERSKNFSGHAKANFRIKTCWIVAQFLAQKPDSLLQSLTDSFIVSFSKLKANTKQLSQSEKLREFELSSDA